MRNNLLKYYTILRLDENASIPEIEGRRDELIKQLNEKDIKYKKNYQKDIINITVASKILIQNKKNQELSKENPDSDFKYDILIQIGMLVMVLVICAINILSLL